MIIDDCEQLSLFSLDDIEDVVKDDIGEIGHAWLDYMSQFDVKEGSDDKSSEGI